MAKERGDGRYSIKHGASRTARLARWLERTPPDREAYRTLALEARIEGDWSRVQAWDLGQVTAALADEINGTAQEYANEQGTYTAFRCVWWCEDTGKYWTSYELRVHPENLDGEQVVGQSFAGDVQSINIQTQRHLEFMMRQHIGGFATVLQALRETVGTQSDQLSSLIEDNLEKARRIVELEASQLATESALDKAVERAEEIAEEADKNDKAQNVVTLVTQALANQKKPS